MLALPVCRLGIILGPVLLRMHAVNTSNVMLSAKRGNLCPKSLQFTDICRREPHLARFSSHPFCEQKVIPVFGVLQA
jgi:hypothetical protein